MRKRSFMSILSSGNTDLSRLGHIWDGPSHSGNCVVVRPINIQDLLWKTWVLCAPDQREKWQSTLLSATFPKLRLSNGMGVSVLSAKFIYTSVMAALMQRSTLRFSEQHMLLYAKPHNVNVISICIFHTIPTISYLALYNHMR